MTDGGRLVTDDESSAIKDQLVVNAAVDGKASAVAPVVVAEVEAQGSVGVCDLCACGG